MPWRPALLRLRHDDLDGGDDVEDVGAVALDDADADRGLAIEAGVALRILERAAHFGDVPEVDDALAVHLHWQSQHVFRGFDDARHLDGEAALLRLH